MGTEPKEKVGRRLPTTVAGRLMKRSVPMKRARNQARRAGPKFTYRPPDIVSVSYQSAMLRTVADAERVPVHKFSAPDIPAEALEAIRSELGEALGGAHGDPSRGEPLHLDRLGVEQLERTT